MIDKYGRTWPDKSDEHIMPPPKHRKTIDANYKYKRKNPFYKFFSFLLRILALIVLPIYDKFVYRYKIIGKKNLKEFKKNYGFVVANHCLNMDAGTICSSIFRFKKLYFVVLGVNSTIPVAGSILKSLGAIPIADNIGGTKKMIAHCNSLVGKHHPILIFPEKALWNGYMGLRPFDNGAFKMAVKNQVPILPIVICLKFRNKKMTKYKAYYYIEQPIYANKNLPPKEQVNDLKDRTINVYQNRMNEFYK